MSDAKSRRQFLKGLAAAAAGTLLAACQLQTVIVKETVVVEEERLIPVATPNTIDSDRLLIVPGRSAILKTYGAW